jgi:hypothetical protein
MDTLEVSMKEEEWRRVRKSEGMLKSHAFPCPLCGAGVGVFQLRSGTLYLAGHSYKNCPTDLAYAMDVAVTAVERLENLLEVAACQEGE